MGRKKLVINWDKLNSYIQLKATRKSCAMLLEVSEDTIDRNVKSEHGMTFTEYAAAKFEPIKLKLVQKALSKAMDGDNTMLIFCLKNLCGWTDRQENVNDGLKVQINIDTDDNKL